MKRNTILVLAIFAIFFLSGCIKKDNREINQIALGVDSEEQ